MIRQLVYNEYFDFNKFGVCHTHTASGLVAHIVENDTNLYNRQFRVIVFGPHGTLFKSNACSGSSVVAVLNRF